MRVLCRRTTPDDFGRNRWADISIPVLRVEDDLDTLPWKIYYPKFQSTSSVWRTTAITPSKYVIWDISIHVLRVEDDLVSNVSISDDVLFQSTSSVWRTTVQCSTLSHQTKFQSTSSVWRTTGEGIAAAADPHISIHVLRVEDDPVRRFRLFNMLYFNPRPPCGGRHILGFLQINALVFQSTSSVWRTTHGYHVLMWVLRFQSTSSVWRTTPDL